MSARTLEERMTKVEELTDKRSAEVGFIKEKVVYLCQADIVNSAKLTRLHEEQIVCNGRIKNVEESVGTLYLKVDGLEQRVQGLDTKVEVLTTKVDGLDKRMDGFDKRMDGLDKRMDGLDKRMDAFQTTLDAMHTTMKSMNTTNESVAMSLKVIAEKVGATQN